MPCTSICNGDFDPVTLLVKEKGLCDRTLVCLSKDQVSRKARSSNQASFKERIKRSRPYFRLDCRRRWKYRSHYDDYPLLNNIRLIPRGLQVALWRHSNSVIRVNSGHNGLQKKFRERDNVAKSRVQEGGWERD